MAQQQPLPDAYLALMDKLEEAYLQSDDPLLQSGYGGGAERWRLEREPILEALPHGGDLLDIGCANGHLLECLVSWGRERGLALEPYGLDRGPRLVELARRRLPQWADRFYFGSGWDWQPPQLFQNVYTLYDVVPPDYLAAYVARLLAEVVAPGGRLIVGAYGSRSRQLPPFDIAGFLAEQGYAVQGRAFGNSPPVTALAWVDRAG